MYFCASMPKDARVVYRRCGIPLADDLQEIKRLLVGHGIRFLILDSALGACGGELEKPETAERLFRALRALRVGTLVIAHPPKNAETPSIFGSTFFRNYARLCWHVQKVQEIEDATLHLALEQTKNNLDRLHAPIGLQLHFGADTITLNPYDVAHDPDLRKMLPLADRIGTLLKDRTPRTANAVADDLDEKPGSVSRVLRRYKGRRWVRSEGNEVEGTWSCL